MKNKLLLMMLTFVVMIGIVGCGKESQENLSSTANEQMESSRIKQDSIEDSKEEENADSVQKTEDSSENTDITKTTETETSSDLTFQDLAKREFWFSSGVGGWSEEFEIEKDGSFSGLFHDSDMGDTGEGYPDGIRYYASYTGHFTNLTKINDYTYQMKLADISYVNVIGTEELADNVLYKYTDSYCLGGTDTFKVYLPGTPLSELSEEVISWISMSNESETELTMTIIADEVNGYGICSYERKTPLEEAQNIFNSHKATYDDYNNKLSNADTTAEMVEYSGLMYETSDECLNSIWNIIKENVDEEKYNQILAEQRTWITQKEAQAEAARAEYEGGSFAPVSYNETLATLTIKRCEELVEYLE